MPLRLLEWYTCIGSIRTFCPLGYFWACVYWDILNSNTRQEKLSKYTKILHFNKSSYITFWVKMSLYSQYTLFTKRIETFWSRDISSMWGIRKFWTISRLYVSNCSRYFLIYILRQNVPKQSDKKDFEIYQVCVC